jgi:hypothetical protein
MGILKGAIKSFLLGLIAGGGLGLYLGFRGSKLLYVDTCPRCWDHLVVAGGFGSGFSMRTADKVEGIWSDNGWEMVERAKEAKAGGERIRGWILECWPGLKKSYVEKAG